ncbi:transposase family protein [Streptomyces sp. Qhu-G9]|nr:transposase family protein [Streptomyces aurantiacus]WAU82236.1 transposase family protein [Streptomyces aurantiacus]
MTRQQFSDLIDALTPTLEVQREQVLRTRRGHERMVALGTDAKAKLTPADRVLATVLHLRKLATMDLLGQLFGVTAMTITISTHATPPLTLTAGAGGRSSRLHLRLQHRNAAWRDTDGPSRVSVALLGVPR